ncbi:MAG: DNA polymerase III subunit gamma/tau [Acidobacteria bacterium]|nr:DNA polymerase III subunit gamma/tau [Acidobacteriota bacterium]
MYQVIARKYRPQTFADVVNQEHVKRTLENAIAQNRIAHGYIFSGQRGTGKTTLARILARCLNCVEGPATRPCGACASCLEISGSGGALDVIEIDAASNRGINEMRELRENVRFRPARDRYKVFIIDEAHQITSEAFNALLKTIEEPPPWVVFVLCTTEAHKIPATVASRCQHFAFRSIDFGEILARMEEICRAEGIESDPEALAAIAIAGEGSMRDSLSALDQAIARCGAKLELAEVRALLGVFGMELLEQIAEALASGSSGRMLEIVDELERTGENLQHFSRELARYFRNLLVVKISGADTRLVAAAGGQRARLAATAERFSEEDLTRYLQLSLDLFRDLQQSLQPRFHLEIGLVKLVYAGRLGTIEEALARLGPAAETGGPAAQRAGPAPVKAAPAAAKTSPGARKPAPPAEVPSGQLPLKPALEAALRELKLEHTADLVKDAAVSEAAGELRIESPEPALLKIEVDNIGLGLKKIGKALKVRIAPGSGQNAAAGESAAAGETAPPDDLRERALGHPEVRRFQEVFGGEVRQVRNLKE